MLNDASRVADFEIDPDMIAACGDGFGLGPVDGFDGLALFVFLQDGITEIHHDLGIDAEGIAKERCIIVLCADQAVVRGDNDGPAFI